MKCIYLNAKKQELPTVIDIEDTLGVFYKLIECQYVDMVRRKIGNDYYVIICDDECLFEEKPIVSAIGENCETMFVGNLIISKDDGEGGLIDLTKEDINQIMQNTVLYFAGKKAHIALKMSY